MLLDEYLNYIFNYFYWKNTILIIFIASKGVENISVEKILIRSSV